MELAGLVLLCDGASPLAANAYGAVLLESQDWPKIHAEICSRLQLGSGGAVFALARMKGQAPWIVWLTSVVTKAVLVFKTKIGPQ